MLKRGGKIKSGKSLRKSGKIKTTKKAVKKTGKRSQKRKEVNKELFQYFAENKIDFCELNSEKCTGNQFLTIAHSKKSRKIHTDEDWHKVALLCVECHNKIEYLPANEMEEIIENLIKKRGNKNDRN
ncbi:MAG TPA: hypothetical protein PLP33_27790 [Leptospiraceae bacterium]|nr:hypothetical protein [Leptospiraceae bacterium]